jgi:hypothetical protein
LQARSVADLAYFHYLDDTYDSEVIGNLAADARFTLVPERIEWVVADNFGQVLMDPFAPTTPDNRENINVFSTGPGFTLPMGRQNFLRLDGRYSLVSYEESPFDSDSVSAQVAVGHAFSAASRVSLNGRREEISFREDDLDADYDQTEAFIRFAADGARTHLTVDAGYSEVEPEGEDSQDGMLLRLDASRRLSGASTAVLRAGREFVNSGSAFAAAQTSSSVSLNAVPGRQSEEPFTRDYASLGWSFARNRTSLSLALAWSEDSYEDVADPSLDQNLLSLGAQFSRQISSRTSVNLQARYGEGEFEAGPDYEEVAGSVGVSFQVSRRIVLGLMYDYYQRDSDDPINEGTENRIWLSIGYGNGVPRREYAAPEFAVDRRT